MSSQAILGASIPIVITLLLAILTVIGFGLMLHVGRGIRKEPIGWMFVLFAIAIVVGPITSGRNLSGASIFYEADLEVYGEWIWIGRFANIGIFLLSVECLVRFIFSRNKPQVFGWPLFAAFVCYILTNNVVNGIWGTVPQLSYQSFTMIVAMLAVTIVASHSTRRLLWFAKVAVLGILLLSLATGVVNPAIVLQQGYTEGLMSIRYWGLATHPNTLSPLIVCMLCCLWVEPFQRVWINRVVWLFGLASLLLTQSKTAILACFVLFSILVFYRYRDGATLTPGKEAKSGNTFVRLLLIGSMVAIAALLVAQLAFDISRLAEASVSTRAGRRALTLSSRDLIWTFALAEWRANPWFGYGPLIFEPRYRMMIGIPQAFHAHNQFMQSLGAAGYVGVAGLFVFVATLGIYAWRAARFSGGLSLGLFAFIFLRSITEVPLSIRGTVNGEFFFLVVTIAICIAHQPGSVRLRKIATAISERTVSQRAGVLAGQAR